MRGVRGEGDKRERDEGFEREERRRRETGGFVGRGFFGKEGEKMKRKGERVQKLATKERERKTAKK